MHRSITFSVFTATLLLFALCAQPAGAQHADSVLPMRYRFVPGQQLTYRVLAYDSIVVRDTVVRTLARERAELVTFRCDSALPDSYVMSMTVTDYNAVERADGGKQVERARHPWVGRTIRFRMTPSGRRLTLLTTGDETPGTSPGGPVAPLLLPNLGGDTAHIGMTSSFKNDQWLVDNVYPPVMWAGTNYRSLIRRMDTLGARVIEVELSDVGNATYKQSGKDDPAVRTVTNGGGSCFLSVERGYPIAGSYDRINSIAMTFPGGHAVEGRHSVGMLYELLPSGGTHTAREERLRGATEVPNEELPKDAGKPAKKPARKKKKAR